MTDNYTGFGSDIIPDLSAPLDNDPITPFDPSLGGEQAGAIGKPESLPSWMQKGEFEPLKRGALDTMKGANQSGTIAGAGNEFTTNRIAQSLSNGQQQEDWRDPYPEGRKYHSPGSQNERIKPRPSTPEEKQQDQQYTQENVLRQIAYDLSPAQYDPVSIGASLVGQAASPESFIGLPARGVILAEKALQSFASRPWLQKMLVQGAEQAVVNTAIDPAIQAIRTTSGAQEKYDIEQTLMAAPSGLAIGAGLSGAGQVVGKVLSRGAGEPSVRGEAALSNAVKEPDPEAVKSGIQEQPALPKEAAQNDYVLEAIARDLAPVKQPDLNATNAIKPHSVETASGKKIEVSPLVVEASSLKSSSDAGYDMTLQPRQRDRAASELQINDIAANLNPERLGYSSEADRGAPIVGNDGVVESGNGRVMAIRKAYEDNGPAIERYKDWLATQGVDVSKYKQPVLVRERLTDMTPDERQAFTVDANRAATLSLSAPERAASDAKGITTDMLSEIKAPDDLGSSSNVGFTKSFLKTLPQSEYNSLVDTNGVLSSEGLSRARNAIIQSAYGSRRLLERVTESSDDNVKSISNALVAAAPEWAKLRRDILNGQVPHEFDLTPDLLLAIEKTSELRRRNIKFNEFVSQQDAFEPFPDRAMMFMEFFRSEEAGRATSAVHLKEGLNLYTQEARKVIAEQGLDFGLKPITPDELQGLSLKKIRELQKNARNNPADQGAFFDGNTGLSKGNAENSTGVRQQQIAAKRKAGGKRGQNNDPGSQTGNQGADLNFSKRGSSAERLLKDAVPIESLGKDIVAASEIKSTREIGKVLVDAFEGLLRSGRVQAGALGQFNTKTGVSRIRSLDNFEVLAHEIGHDVHLNPANTPVLDDLLSKNLIELQDLGYGDGKNLRREKFADFFQHYSQNRAYAERNYPGMTRDFEAWLQKEKPEQWKAMQKVHSLLEARFKAQPADIVAGQVMTVQTPGRIERLKEAILPEKSPDGMVIYSMWDKLITNFSSMANPVKKLVEGLTGVYKRNTGEKVLDILPEHDPYMLIRMAPGARSKAIAFAQYGIVPVGEVNPKGASLREVAELAGIHKSEKAYQWFGDYLMARRAMGEYARYEKGELVRQPVQQSKGQLEAFVKEAEKQYPAFTKAANKYYEWNNNFVIWQFQKGVVPKEYLEAAARKIDYAPLSRDMSKSLDNNGTVRVSSGQTDGSVVRDVMNTFRGSDRPVLHPLEATISRLHNIMKISNYNDVARSIDRLASIAGYGSGVFAERIPSNQLKSQKIDLIEALRQAGHKIDDKLELADLILEAEATLGDATYAVLFKQEPIKKGAEPIIFFYDQGERKALRLADGRLGRDLYNILNPINDYESDIFSTVFAGSATILRNSATQWNPDFIFPNVVMDQLTSLATGGRKYKPFIDAVIGAIEAFKESDVAIRYASQGGIGAGAVNHVFSASPEAKTSSILKPHNSAINNVKRVFEVSEAGTRIGLYKAYEKQATEMGYDAVNAAGYSSFKATDYMDYNNAGAAMQWMRRYVPFLNAAIQGNTREIIALTDAPRLWMKLRTEKLSIAEIDRLRDGNAAVMKMIVLGLGTVGLSYINRDWEEYKTAPNWKKDSNFLIRGEDGVEYKIPKPYGFVRITANLFERAANRVLQDNPEEWAKWRAGALDAITLPHENPLMGTLYGLTLNKNPFTGREIETQEMRNVAKPYRYDASTSEAAKFLGAAGNWTRLSPVQIDYIGKNFGAGLYRIFTTTTDNLLNRDRPAKQVWDWPIFYRFMGRSDKASQMTRDFWDLVSKESGRYSQGLNTFNKILSEGKPKEADEFLSTLKPDEKTWVYLHSAAPNGDRFEPFERNYHPLVNAESHSSVIRGLIKELANGSVIQNLVDLNRNNIRREKADAERIGTDSITKAKVMDELYSMSMRVVRNAMKDIGAPSTGSILYMDEKAPLEIIKLLSPDIYQEYVARMNTKKLPSPEQVRRVWPEMQRRLNSDGYAADLSDIVGQTPKKPSRKTRQPAFAD